MSKWIVSLAAVALSAMMFSGCGGESGSSAVDTGDGDGQSNTEQPTNGTTGDFTSTPNQFGDKLPAVPVMPDME